MVKLQTFNIDLQNGMASFFYQDNQNIPGKLNPFAQLNVPVPINETKTTQDIRHEGLNAAEHFLQEILDEIRKVK